VADVLLLGALITLTAIAAYHLSLLAKLDQSATPRITEHRGA
jgi:hypothetical protein